MMVALLGIVVGISQAIVGEVCADHRRLEARMKAESLAFRLAASGHSKEPAIASGEDYEPQSRGLASIQDGMSVLEGQIGEDPWGHPYRYALKKDSLGNVSEVAVWSGGVLNAPPIRYVYTAPLQSRNRLVPAVSN